jgi:hypothetical protein
MPEALRFSILSLPLAALAIQSPLWFARCYLGWRLTSPRAGHLLDRPLSIGDYLVGTTVVAVSITCARLAPPADWNVSGYWPVWAIVCACFAGGSALSIIPALLAIFRLRDWRIGLALLMLYGLVAGLVTLASILKAFGAPGGPGPMWVRAGLVSVFVWLAGFLAAPMIVARKLGFELVLSRSPPAASLGGGGSPGTVS